MTEREYLPYADETQPPRAIHDYPRSQRRTPIGPFVRRPLTRSERTGPTGLDRKLRMGPEDMSRPVPGAPQAIGQFHSISGVVLDEDGAPVPGAILELWQANSAGKYVHEFDHNDAPRDPNFVGAARLVTDADGRFAFYTIKPGAYPVASSAWEWRAPHIHVSIFGHSWMSRLVTQLFYPGEPLNAQDVLLNSIPSEAARARLIIRPLPTRVQASNNLLEFEHQFVLRGRTRTPTVIDDDDTPGPSLVQGGASGANGGATTTGPFASMTTGPFFPPQFLEPGCGDLTRYDGARAEGTRILLTGRVLEVELAPTVNTIVEIWQADANGIFRHPKDPRFAQVDPGFAGWGRGFTDTDGWYRLHTVLPGSYLAEDGTPRCPHINVMLLASGILRPLVTTVFFAETPDAAAAAGASDPVLSCVDTPERRARLIAVRDPERDANGVRAYRFDLVLRGETETPFFLD